MKTISILLMSLSLSVVGVGCGKPPVALVNTDMSAAAQGQVKVKDGGNGNAELVVEVHHLPKADKAAPGATTYVVWAKPASGDPMNLGALAIDDDLSGTLKTVTPMKNFDLMITAEPSAQSTKPTGSPLMTARVSRE